MDVLETVKNHLKQCSPKGDLYIIIPEKGKKQTSGGFMLADENSFDRKQMKGEIVAKGKGRLLEGALGRQEMEYEVGDIVIFRKNAGDDLYYDENLEIYPSHREEREDLVPVKIILQDAILFRIP